MCTLACTQPKRVSFIRLTGFKTCMLPLLAIVSSERTYCPAVQEWADCPSSAEKVEVSSILAPAELQAGECARPESGIKLLQHVQTADAATLTFRDGNTAPFLLKLLTGLGSLRPRCSVLAFSTSSGKPALCKHKHTQFRIALLPSKLSVGSEQPGERAPS